VYVWNNTSVIVDEVLAHRIGLVPLNVDPALLDAKDGRASAAFSHPLLSLTRPPAADDPATDRNTLVFRLQATCTRNPSAPKGSIDPAELFVGHEVTAGELVWAPAGDQAAVFGARAPAPTNPHIVLDKLRPGQELDIELHAVKGVGKDHAKFSPVGARRLVMPRPAHALTTAQRRRRTASSRASSSTQTSPCRPRSRPSSLRASRRA
jgi:DNA-directed RNA polymerase I and III subunit RPAC1